MRFLQLLKWVLLCFLAIIFYAQQIAPRISRPGSATAQKSPPWRPVSPLFDPALAHQLLDDPARDRWQKPAEIVRTLQLKAGDHVADIGSGSGYLLPHLSRAVGAKGRVYAEEVQPAYLRALRKPPDFSATSPR